MTSSMFDENAPSRRVRGISKGKNTARIFKHTQKKIPVSIDVQFNAFVGDNASKVACALGIELRKKAPIGVSRWSDVDAIIKDSIVQGVLDWFNIEGYGTNTNTTKVVDSKCQSLYRGWKCRAKRYYDSLLAKGKDPYAHCFPSMKDTQWKHMIENVWITESFKKRSETNKASRNHVTYNHTMGSKSFASGLYELSTKAKNDQVHPKFSDFFKFSHQRRKNGGVWIDQCCEEDYVAIEELETELFTNGEEVPPEELSQSIFGKKNYLKGLGPNMKASSKMKSNNESNIYHSDDVQAELETLRNARQDYEVKCNSQEAMIKSQGEMIESQNKKIEELANRHTRFFKLLLAGGSLGDESLGQGNGLTYTDLIT